MKTVKRIIICSIALVVLGGCAYRHYLGMHGPSVRNAPDVHEGVTEDAECLGCHHPDRNPTGPLTSHPQFTGCLKCHSDPIK
jgi:uracil-DNA glycosylase